MPAYRRRRGYRRRRTYRRRRLTRKRSYRRGRRSYRRGRRQDGQYVNVCRQTDFANWVMPAGQTVDYRAFVFSLTDMPGYTQFTTMYDQYRINKIKVTFIPMCDIVTAGDSSSGTQKGRICFKSDFDDATTPTSILEILNSTHSKCRSYPKNFSYTLIPTSLAVTYETDVTSGYAPKRRQWIDCNDPVKYYGLKGFMEQFIVNSDVNKSMKYKVYARYWVTFKNMRFNTINEGKIYGEPGQPNAIQDPSYPEARTHFFV